MNTTDVQLVLGYASSIDPRVRRNDPTERQFQVTAWSAQLAHFDAADARDAIEQLYAASEPH